MYVHRYVRTYVYMYVCTGGYVCMYVCMYVCIYLCMYVCMYVSMYVCMYICNLLFNFCCCYESEMVSSVEMMFSYQMAPPEPFVQTNGLVGSDGLRNFDMHRG